MDIAKPNNHNFNYIGDASKGIADLPVRVGEDAELGRTITSAWKPTEEELLKLINGGLVTLCIFGHGQPPVMLGVESTTGDLFRQEPLNGVIGYAQQWSDISGAEPVAYTFDQSLDHAKGRLPVLGWEKRGEPFPVAKAIGYTHTEMTPEDAACPILALAPAEYTYWEKRVWRRGVCDMESRGEVARAVSASLSKMEQG